MALACSSVIFTLVCVAAQEIPPIGREMPANSQEVPAASQEGQQGQQADASPQTWGSAHGNVGGDENRKQAGEKFGQAGNSKVLVEVTEIGETYELIEVPMSEEFVSEGYVAPEDAPPAPENSAASSEPAEDIDDDDEAGEYITLQVPHVAPEPVNASYWRGYAQRLAAQQGRITHRKQAANDGSNSIGTGGWLLPAVAVMLLVSFIGVMQSKTKGAWTALNIDPKAFQNAQIVQTLQAMQTPQTSGTLEPQKVQPVDKLV